MEEKSQQKVWKSFVFESILVCLWSSSSSHNEIVSLLLFNAWHYHEGERQTAFRFSCMFFKSTASYSHTCCIISLLFWVEFLAILTCEICSENLSGTSLSYLSNLIIWSFPLVLLYFSESVDFTAGSVWWNWSAVVSCWGAIKNSLTVV